MKKKQFREVLKSIDLSSTNASLAYTVKNQYTKYLLPFETKMKDSFSTCVAERSSEQTVREASANDCFKRYFAIGTADEQDTTNGSIRHGTGFWHARLADARSRCIQSISNEQPNADANEPKQRNEQCYEQ